MWFGLRSLDDQTGLVGATLAHSLQLSGRNRLRKGRVLTPEDIAAIAGAGITEVTIAVTEAGDMMEDAAAAHIADVFGLHDGKVAFLSHCGSRGVGHRLASGQFKALEEKFQKWGVPFPGGDKQLVYAPLGTPEANAY